MSKIDELINKYCPDGVEYRELGEVVNILDSQRKPVSKSNRKNGKYPYYGANGIQDYVDDYIFDGTFILLGEDGSVINKDGSPVLNWATGKIWVNNHAHILSEKIELAYLRYVYFALSVIDVTKVVKGNIPKITQQNLRSFSIPIPPLPVQEEIVKILDSFTELEQELEQELELRKKQYEYYRDGLLTFGDEVEWKTLEEVCESITAGGDLPEKYLKGQKCPDEEYPYPIYSNGSNDNALYGFTNNYKVEKDAVTISARGTIGYHTVRKGKFTPIVRLITLIPNNFINIKFLNYILDITIIGSSGGSIPQLTVPDVKKISIPIPPLSEQERIVSILDKFDALVNDISIGLPAEIEARRKQYEYYRDKLLTFKKLES